MEFWKKYISNDIKHRTKVLIPALSDCFLYFLNKNKIADVKLGHTVFVCHGNVCRSPFAEYYLRSRIPKSAILVESCGLNVHHCGPSPEMAINVSEELGVDLNPHLSKSYTACDLAHADLIIPMEYSQYLHLLSIFPNYREKIYLLKDFSAWPHRFSCNIYDPYGRGKSVYKDCFRQIQKAIDLMLARQDL
ncbi:MAG: hypothetical protein F9K32_14040 [Desulfobulbaceae bacterium]|nr:MAG: hypothetical protein F9K32_14040 [Desulfobulbaceae bacterium]